MPGQGATTDRLRPRRARPVSRRGHGPTDTLRPAPRRLGSSVALGRASVKRRDRRRRRKRVRRRPQRRRSWRLGSAPTATAGRRRIPVPPAAAQDARGVQSAEHPAHRGGPHRSRASDRARRSAGEAEQTSRQERRSASDALPAVHAVPRLEDLGRARVVWRLDLRLVFDRADARLSLALLVRLGRLLRPRWTGECRRQNESDDLRTKACGAHYSASIVKRVPRTPATAVVVFTSKRAPWASYSPLGTATSSFPRLRLKSDTGGPPDGNA